jgi:hypothetical protein
MHFKTNLTTLYSYISRQRISMHAFIISVILLISVILSGCNKSNPNGEEHHSPFEVIEHAAIHMQDATGLTRSADTVMPGRHLDKDSIEHRRIDVTLKPMGNGYGGYIHFGPDITGDMIVCANIISPITVTNRTGSGDTPIEIEITFTIAEIADSAKTSFIKTAILFEAKTGGNILKIGPVQETSIKLVIEEAEHEHH